ncbi:phage baseplate protein [Entomohabitans teleogrylli]|uniref:phage baseplate protein n=1 Tax=Entomohabitans teleogrylli TaxID=1384589 RepID=UPI00073D83FC|nr:hypothetical protein [Entomohabitans teleogrylli]
MAEKTEVYGIYSDKFALRFDKMILLKASVMREAKLMEHPLEDGSTIADHRILQPVEIEIPVLLPAGDYTSLYREINQAWIDTELFNIHTRVGIFKSMAFAAMPHDENPDQVDVIPMVLRFKEVRLVTTQYQALPARKVARPRDQSTVSRGEQTGIEKKDDTLLEKILF